MKERHLLALSGGKDSAALAVYMREKYPKLPLEYVFIDSGCELPETYEFLDRIEAMLDISIIKITPEKGFLYWLKFFNGVLPSPKNRWCTKYLKIIPYRDWLKKYCKNVKVINYAGLRADEDREGFEAKSDLVVSRFPFVDDGLVLADILDILEKSGLGLPTYYRWRKRSGCYFCFYQKDDEWRGLRKKHPDLFEKVCRMEENHSDGRQYTWRKSGYLREIKDEKSNNSNREKTTNQKLIDMIEENVICSHSYLNNSLGGDADGTR
jgi:hypothetical protein